MFCSSVRVVFRLSRVASSPRRFASMNVGLALLSLCLGLASAAPRIDPDLDGHWQLWKSWHSKDYHEVRTTMR